MTNTATQHIQALLVDDGREFAMIRKSDLAALMRIAETDPHQGRFLDPLAVAKRRICTLERITDSYHREMVNANKDALKHGVERRRYMANNKALLARQAVLEAELLEDELVVGRVIEQLELTTKAEVEARTKLRRFKRKFPAIGALMDATQ